MLKKGEQARSTEMRSNANSASVRALAELLNAIIKGHAPADAAVLTACESQGALAALSVPRLGIQKMSLNTLKAASNRELGGGWLALNSLRLKVRKRSLGDSAKKKAQRRPSALREKFNLLQNRQDGSIRTRAILSRAYLDVLTMFRNAAKHNPALSGQLERHQATFGTELGLLVAERERARRHA